MAHKFNPKHLQKLDNLWRRENLPAEQTLRTLGLVEGDVFADIGAGIGYFTIPASSCIIRNNSIFALDTSQEMLDQLKLREQEINGDNRIIPVLTDEYDFKLDEESVTFVLLANVLHEIDDKTQFIRKIKKILKNEGKFAIVEWIKSQTEFGPPTEHRIAVEKTRTLLLNEGFIISSEHEFANQFYSIVAIKT